MAAPYTDGAFTAFKQNGPTRINYPFLNSPTKDSTTKQYEYDGVILPGSYTPLAAGSTWPGDGTFAADNAAYIVNETSPRPMLGAYEVTRRYSKIPIDQTVYGAAMLNRPVMHDIKSGSSYAVSFDSGFTSHVFTSRKTASISGTPDVPDTYYGNTANPLSAALISLTSLYYSTSFYTNDNVSTIAEAVSYAVTGLTTNSYNVIVTKSLYGISISSKQAAGYSASASSSSTDIEMSGVIAVASGSLSITTAKKGSASTRTLSSTAHGGVAGDFVALWNGDKLWSIGKVVSSVTNSFTVELDAAPGKDDVVTHCEFAKNGTRYINGPVSVSTKSVSKFYYPGVTVGITTPDDIPLVTPKIEPIQWLAEIVAYIAGGSLVSYYTCINGSNLDQWEGPIYKQTTIYAQMADALDTTTSAG